MQNSYWRYARRMIVLVFGGTLLLLGIVLIFLPGPALLILPVALAVLGSEFVWARRLLKRVKKEAERWMPFGKNV
ncbi:MAG: PGPGW domain-containing protein [Elusimicrobia bacterium]|nr:PGPGW domain-containing protein [Elusimicrobiota bacterium]